MKAIDLIPYSINKYVYLERYVNDGSPSGYTLINTTSVETNPISGDACFKLKSFDTNRYRNLVLGDDCNIFNNLNFAHPDSEYSKLFKMMNIQLASTEFVVAPTASSRTVLVINKNSPYFLKLNYDIGKIGRCDRHISKMSALASYENSNYIIECIKNKKLPIYFSILPENCAKITYLENNGNFYEWGTIFREYPSTNNTIVVPAFSLFSKDYNNKNDDCLINQFITLNNSNPREYLIKLLVMLIDCYWSLLLKCGLVAELHSQNCLVELNYNFDIKRIIIRDMEDVDRDNYIAELNNIEKKWESFGYKTYNITDDEYKYRTSYMYDFKFGIYLLEPLINAVCSKYNINKDEIYKFIKNYVNSKYLCNLPDNYFFDKNIWVSRSNQDNGLIRKKTYILNEKPKFR